jgi:energy-coupling factor transporter ATP-binding protein EcfA2
MVSLAGFGVRDFRSVFGEPQVIAPLQTVNLLAGQNNTGKSNMLRVAHGILGACRGTIYQARIPELTMLDVPAGLTRPPQMELLVGLSTGGEDAEALLTDVKRAKLDGNGLRGMRLAFGATAFKLTSDDDIYWFRFSINLDESNINLVPSVQQLTDATNQFTDPQERRMIGHASSNLTSSSGGRSIDDLERIVREIGPLQYIPPVRTIVAFRQIQLSEGGASIDDIEASPDEVGSGQAVVKYLLRLQNPDHSRIADKLKFTAINDFVKTILEDPTAQLSVPYHGKTIHVTHHGRELPLERVGTGIHQVIILAAAATMTDNNLVCIEEPEIHLHPLLQRKFISFLADSTSNRYLIATHSAHMLDTAIGNIFHATMADDGTRVRLAATPPDQAAISMDLGYRPSDLVQTNAIIWVEGPSDRIYLRHWIRLLDPSLSEGIHFSLMFYGGGLLNHLSGDDPDLTDDYISLRRMNRKLAIVMDSDKTSSRARINGTKKRIRQRFDDGDGFAWISHGYTVENYVPTAVMRQAIHAAHKNATSIWSGDRFVNPLHPSQFTGAPKVLDKIAISRAVIQLWDHDTEWVGDLRAQVQQTIEFIREANGLPEVGM